MADVDGQDKDLPPEKFARAIIRKDLQPVMRKTQIALRASTLTS